MSRLDDYRTALLVADPDASADLLNRALDDGGAEFVSFVINHGLGPMWHARTEREEFGDIRRSAEALYLAQSHALEEINVVFERAGVGYAVIKGVASRALLYENPALRACHDLDLLVRPEDRVRAANQLIGAGFSAHPEARSISRELVLTRDLVTIDLHWALVREGRLRIDDTAGMLARRRRVGDIWMLSPEDALFVLLVHPAFAKHLAGWEMGLHRVTDVLNWLRMQGFEWRSVVDLLANQGVQTAAWATLQWVDFLAGSNAVPRTNAMMADIRPGRIRRVWLNHWLRTNLSERTSERQLLRLVGFSQFLHDTPRDSVRALAGWHRAQRRSRADLEVFRDLAG